MLSGTSSVLADVRLISINLSLSVITKGYLSGDPDGVAAFVTKVLGAKSIAAVPFPTCIFLFVESQDILASVVDDVVARVNVGVFIVGLVRVLFVKVSVSASVASVPVVGSVTFVVAV